MTRSNPYALGLDKDRKGPALLPAKVVHGIEPAAAAKA